MKTKSKYISALLLTGLILGLCIAMRHPCFSEDKQSTDSQVPYKKPTSDFKQLTNQELFEVFLLRIPPEDREYFSRDRVLNQQQGRYNYYLDMILVGYFLHNSEIRDQLDKSRLEKLAWVIETDKTSYKIGERINICLSLQNISDEEVLIYPPDSGRKFLLLSMNLKKCEKTESPLAYLTEGAYEDAYIHPDASIRRSIKPVLREPGELKIPAMETILLKPGDKVPVDREFLNPFYDLSQPREYELTFYTRNFLGSDDEQIGEFPKPCTIRFKIEGNTNWLDNQVVWPEEEQ